jgi:uncharacterized membrane protein
MYLSFKVIHLLGVVLFLGNIIVTAVWKSLSDQTREPRTIAYAQRLVTVTDWVFTLGGIALILVVGYGMVATAGLNPLGQPWLIWGQGLFIASAIIWVLFLIPTQIAQARRTSLCSRRPDPRELLASWPTLGHLGNHRHTASFGQSLFHGLQTVSALQLLRLAEKHAGAADCVDCSY